MLAELLIIASLLLWFIVLSLPWQPWRVREHFAPEPAAPRTLADVTVVIPARNEADVIGSTLTGLRAQGNDLRVIVVDDASGDGTAEAAAGAGLKHLTIIQAPPLPPGWSGKLWALEQGCRRVQTHYVLFLDADILLQGQVVAGLLAKLEQDQLQLVSLMARLRMVSAWEKLLMPAFVYFFKLLYPFALANSPRSRQAAAAGGCILLEKDWLDRIGGLASLRQALIDDCTLARRIKDHGGRIWLGLTGAAISLRRYETLGTIREMVSRTAYTQLRHSPWLLTMCLLLMLISYLVPLAGLFYPGNLRWLALLALALMAISYLPTLRYYRLGVWRALTLPLAGLLFMMMVLDSAWRHYRGTGACWKQRHYPDKPIA